MRFVTAGESHGPSLTAVVEGLPAGMPVDEEKLNEALARRQRGVGRGGRMLIEKDQVEVLSGVRFGKTLGSPITLSIKNRDWENWREDMAPFGASSERKRVYCPRPGHADLSGIWKYGFEDARPVLERASARETAARTAAGAMAALFLEQMGMRFAAHVRGIGGIILPHACQPSVAEIREKAFLSPVGCVDQTTADLMEARIASAKEAGDTLGGIIEVRGEGLTPGLGSYTQWDSRLDGRLAQAIAAIPAIKGVAFGDGFALADVSGSAAHDALQRTDAQGVFRATNHAGGLEGGMTNGETLLVQAAMKPIPTLMNPLASVSLVDGSKAFASTERSDTCAVPAAAVVTEMMTAWVIACAVREKFGGDYIEDVVMAMNNYKARIAQGGAPWQT